MLAAATKAKNKKIKKRFEIAGGGGGSSGSTYQVKTKTWIKKQWYVKQRSTYFAQNKTDTHRERES